MKRNKQRLAAAVLLLAVLVPPAAAADDTVRITEISSGGDSITISWEDNGADRYEISRATSKNGVYRKIGETDRTTYRDSGLTAGRIWYYRIRPCRIIGRRIRYGLFSEPVGQCCLHLIQAPATENPCYRQGRTIAVRGLMLHSVGCAQESGAVFAEVWNQPEAEVLVHAVIEPGGTVYQLADWNLRCWHCGGSGNNDLIGIEMTEPNELRYTSGTEFTWSGNAREDAISNYNTAVSLFANLCFRFDLDPMTDICSHDEGGKSGYASGHEDPEHLWDGLGLNLTMDTFRQDVRKKMDGVYRDRTVKETVGASGTVTADALNIRSGPGTDHAVLGLLPQGEQVTAHDLCEAEGKTWGRLWSGGWICMNYVA